MKKQTENNQLKVCTLSGTNEVGRNSSFLEYKGQIIMIDCGFGFPEQDLNGVDYIIPNFNYLKRNKSKIKAILITHGHLDHTGGLQYVLPEIGFPNIYAGRFANALIKEKLAEEKMHEKVKQIDVLRGSKITIGEFRITFIGVTHSIPNSFSIFVETDGGNVFFSGDYKIDLAPANEPESDYAGLRSLNGKVDLALMESTNAFQEGKSITAMEVEQNVEDIVSQWKGRVIIASFSSLVSRIYSFMQIAKKTHRKIFVSGRSLITALRIAREQKYIEVQEDLFVTEKQVASIEDRNILILCTGSQAERFGALNRISLGEHKQIKAKAGDLIMLSSSEIPSNVIAIQHMTDRLIQIGAEIVNSNMVDIHETGHGMQEDMKMMLDMVNPRYVLPIHGFLTLRYQNKKNFIKWGVKEDRVLLTEDGQMWNLLGRNAEVKRGQKIESRPILIDALGFADAGDVVIKDRQKLAEFGALCVVLNLNKETKAILGSPNFISRGFVNLSKEDKYRRSLETTVRDIHMQWMKAGSKKNSWDEGELIKLIEKRLGHNIFKTIERDPIILTILV